VLDSSSSVPVPTLLPQTCHHFASSVLAVRISCRVIAVFVLESNKKNGEVGEYPQKAKILLTNKIFLLQIMYRHARMVFIVKCITLTRFFIAYAALRWKSVIFYCSVIT